MIATYNLNQHKWDLGKGKHQIRVERNITILVLNHMIQKSQDGLKLYNIINLEKHLAASLGEVSIKKLNCQYCLKYLNNVILMNCVGTVGSFSLP